MIDNERIVEKKRLLLFYIRRRSRPALHNSFLADMILGALGIFGCSRTAYKTFGERVNQNLNKWKLSKPHPPIFRGSTY